MQRRLEQLRRRMIELLQLVRERYARNEQILIRRQCRRAASSTDGPAAADNINKSGAVLRGGTFRFKGNLYFRDVDGRSCPNNEDYEKRCYTEMFPTDFDMRSKHVWTVLDKRNVVMGIKQQLVEHASFGTLPSDQARKRKRIAAHEQTISNLLGAADSSFSIDWHQISSLDVDHRHSPYSCEAMWLVYLQPQLKRDDWSPDEDEQLLAAARKHALQDWQAIAAAVPQRSDYQCFVRRQTTLRLQLEPTSNYKWVHEDNERLRKVVLRNTVNGVINWSQVVEHFPGRSRSTLIGRYTYVLHPSISREPFTPKEDFQLFAAYEEYNGKFNCFPRTLFPNRSLAQLRTRYHNVLAQRNKTDCWSVDDDTKLMDFVGNHGPQWVNCANFLGNHTRTSCRTRFLVIKRFLEQNSHATVADIPRRKCHKNAQVTPENWLQRLEEWQKDPSALIDETALSKRSNRAKRPRREPMQQRLAPLRGLELQFYEYFKYAYNLNLNVPQATPLLLPSNTNNLQMVMRALSIEVPISTAVKIVNCPTLPKALNRCYKKLFRQLSVHSTSAAPALLLPPNWCTMTGFRAICIHSVLSSKKARAESTLDYDESQAAVQLFRQRLRSLFYRTTLLSRLETSMFEELPAALSVESRLTANYNSEAPATPALAKAAHPTDELSSAKHSSRSLVEELELEHHSPKSEPTELIKQEFG
ncbi:Pbp95 [Drosophila busckii]|uniref:Pbp95 n=2 Tax=Drosophila busckii TaxID=30019 RepID=A0A0M4ERN3_DROBS|nr:Pbp95 [Drosophila busckii]